MMKLLVFLIACLSLAFFVGCASPNSNGIDVYSFIPGGSTYKHVKGEQELNAIRQANVYKDTRDDTEDSVIVSVDALSLKDAIASDHGWSAIACDIIKVVGYYFVVENEVKNLK